MYQSTTLLCSCVEVLWELALLDGAFRMPIHNPCRMPFKSAAAHSELGCLARALLHTSAFRGVAMGLAMSPSGTPVCGARWNCGAWSLQNCQDSISAIKVDVDMSMNNWSFFIQVSTLPSHVNLAMIEA